MELEEGSGTEACDAELLEKLGAMELEDNMRYADLSRPKFAYGTELAYQLIFQKFILCLLTYFKYFHLIIDTIRIWFIL